MDSPACEGEEERERAANGGNSMREDTEVRSSTAYSRDGKEPDNPGLYLVTCEKRSLEGKNSKELCLS